MKIISFIEDTDVIFRILSHLGMLEKDAETAAHGPPEAILDTAYTQIPPEYTEEFSAAADPFYRAAWLRPGQHLNLVGSGVPSTSEVEPEVVQRSRYFTDYKESALVLAGEFIRARQAGLVDDDHILGSIGDVLEGRIAGRTGNSDITVFKSLGMVAEDLISADFVLAQAQQRGLGSVVKW